MPTNITTLVPITPSTATLPIPPTYYGYYCDVPGMVWYGILLEHIISIFSGSRLLVPNFQSFVGGVEGGIAIQVQYFFITTVHLVDQSLG